ncbi:1,2-dihydroxy-3-keto-5-methylthiopentene dioxygenase isoform X2 [Ischnura elegans]|uniref:1,2-dihydroxy-3-keto-5-methylthiopentene dioxygenase isoform X2 n=1 Tax=Ischnura elegans TaxID=197161 RepID=UPI001ED87F40|nr:1,2-dihydroxy-3-keto-5-methylthiopentene dioxygenase isoform X2 [Ischnura elegans]
MVSAWLMDNDSGDQRLEHHRSPPVFVSLDDLSKTAGVEYFKVNLESLDTELEDIKRKRGYSYEDEINISRDHLPNYEEKLKIFFQEHLHTDEEIRLVLEGSGYFDVRDHEENWNFIRAKRYFVGEPVWTPHNRPCDEMECRKNYLESMKKKMEE